MKISPAQPSLAGTASSRVDAMKLSPTPGGMSWLLDSGAKQSSSSLLSNSASNSNYYAVSHASTEMLRRHASSEMMRRVHSSSIPDASTEMLRRHPSTELRRSSRPEIAYVAPRQSTIQIESVHVLSQSIQAIMEPIFGLYGLEVWKFDESGSLINVPIKAPNVVDSGMLIKRVTQEADYQSPHFNSAARDAFERLTDTTRLDYINKKTTYPGVGLAGALWSEASTSNTLAALQRVQSISSSIHRRVGILAGMHSTLGREKENNTNSVLWREVDTLAEDPDQPYDERLQSFAKAGFKLAAGIPFDIRGFRGIVVFHANPHADARKLRHPDNSELILFAAQFIGSAAAVQLPIQKATLWKNRRPILNWKCLRVKILAIVRFQRPLRVRGRSRSGSYGSPTMRRVDSFKLGMRRVASFAMDREQSYKMLSEATTRLRNGIEKTVVDVQYASKSKGMKWWQKCKGGHAHIPPAFNTYQCMWTFVGVISAHAIFSWLDYFIVTQSAGKFTLLLGPLGALTTLQYTLTAAPASQPRNAFFAQIIALSTTHVLHQFQYFNRWHRCAIAPAIVTTTTAWLGIIHPPAGASAVVFAYETHEVEDMLIFLCGVAISIFIAVAINNLSDKRQYKLDDCILLQSTSFRPSVIRHCI